MIFLHKISNRHFPIDISTQGNYASELLRVGKGQGITQDTPLTEAQQVYAGFIEVIGFNGFIYKGAQTLPGFDGLFNIVPFTLRGIEMDTVPGISERLQVKRSPNGDDA